MVAIVLPCLSSLIIWFSKNTHYLSDLFIFLNLSLNWITRNYWRQKLKILLTIEPFKETCYKWHLFIIISWQQVPKVSFFLFFVEYWTLGSLIPHKLNCIFRHLWLLQQTSTLGIILKLCFVIWCNSMTFINKHFVHLNSMSKSEFILLWQNSLINPEIFYLFLLIQELLNKK